MGKSYKKGENMGLKDIFKKQPTKENATRGAVFNEYEHSAQDVYNYLQQARARGENVYVVYKMDHPIKDGTAKEFYTLDNMTLNEIEDATCQRVDIKPRAEHEKWLAKQKKDEEQRIEELQAKSNEQDKDLNQFKIASEINQRIDNKEKGIPEFYDFGIER